MSSFFLRRILGLVSCFRSLLYTSSLSHKISFDRDLDFGHRQDTKQVDHAGQKLLSGVNPAPTFNCPNALMLVIDKCQISLGNKS